MNAGGQPGIVSRCRRAAIIVLALHPLVLPAFALAQPAADGQLTGTVRDATGSVILGAVVTLQSPHLIGGARQVTTGGAGTWRSHGLPAGEYRLRVSAAGFRPVDRELLLAPAQTLVVDVELQIGSVTDVQHVDAPAPVVDVRSAAVPVHLDPALLRDLPTSRSIHELINLAPGINGEIAYGGTKQSNGIFVDGVDTTEAAEQGPWLRYNQNWLQEVHVVGLGADAEHGRSTGVNAYGVVRSGANRFSGLGEYWTTRSRWVDSNTSTLPAQIAGGFAPRRVATFWNANGQLGGPFRADRVWFFAGLDHLTLDDAPAGYSGSILQEEDDTRALLKLTAAVSRTWRAEGLAQRGVRRVDFAGVGPWAAPEATTDRRQPQTSWSGRASGALSSTLFMDLRYSGYVSPNVYESRSPDGPPPRYDLLTGYRSSNVLSSGRDERTRQGGSAALAWFADASHELRAGVEWNRARERTVYHAPGGVWYYDLGGVAFQRAFFSGYDASGVTRHLGLFAQARWLLHDRVTLAPGVRIDTFRGSASQGPSVLRTNPLSPRVGIAWDLGGDRRTVVRAHAGRYTDPLFAQPVLLTDDTSSSLLINQQINASGEWVETSRVDLRGWRRVDPELDHSHVDQFIVGLERQIGRLTSLQAQYVHRAFDNFMGFVSLNARWTPVDRRDPGPDGVMGTADDGAVFTVYRLENPADVSYSYANPDDAWRRYRALQLVLRKREADDWQMQASYTWSRTRGNVGSGFHTNAGRGDLAQNLANNPNRLINGDGRAAHDPTHELKLLAAWRPRWLGGFTVSAVARFMTGAAWGRTFVATDLGQGAQQILAEPRGARRVDAMKNVDLRLEKRLVDRGAREIGIAADVFNATNQGVPNSDWVAPVFTTSGPSLGMPTVWRAARQLRLAIRGTF